MDEEKIHTLIAATLQDCVHQGHACIPFCHALDLENTDRAPLCMQFIDGASSELSLEEMKWSAM